MEQIEKEKVISIFKDYGINIESREEYLKNKEKVLEIAKEVIRLSQYAGSEIKEKFVKDLFEHNLKEEDI